MEPEKPKRKGGGAPRHDKNSGLVQYKDGLWGVDIFIEGRRTKRKVGSLSEARRFRDDLKAAARRGDYSLPSARSAPRRRTLGDWIEVYLEIPRGATDERFARNWKASIGRCYPEQFTLEHLRTWFHERLAQGQAISSLWREASCLRATYTEALRSGEIGPQQNPFRDRRALRLPPINNKRDDYLKVAQQDAVRQALGPFWWPYAEFSILTMMRLGNQRQLRWQDIDWDSRVAVLPRTKKGTKFVCPLSARAIAILREQQIALRERGIDSEWCFPNSQGRQLNPAHFRQRVWAPAFRAAGLKGPGGDGSRNGLTWHDLRHTGPTRLAQSGESLFVVQQLLDHADLRTTQRYASHGPSLARQAAERLAELSGRN